MKHSPYEYWIVDEPELTAEEREKLVNHLSTCNHCRQILSGWEISKKTLEHPIPVHPTPGFTNRWQITLARKINLEKVRRYRLSMVWGVMLVSTGSLTYAITSCAFIPILTNIFSAIIRSIIAITNGLSAFGLWVNKIPRSVPFAAGFIFFGLSNALFLAVLLLLWNLKNRKKAAYEITLD